MREPDLLIPALIDFARFGNHDLGTNHIYHFTQTDANDTDELRPNHSMLSDQELGNWLANLGYNFALKELFNGDFIDFICEDFDMNEKEYISHIFRVLSSTPLRHYPNHSDVKLYDIKEFWKTMLDFEILYLQSGINDLGYWEWNNFGIHIYNQLATTQDKMLIFKEVNKILGAILYPFNKQANQKNVVIINLPRNVFKFRSIEVDLQTITTLQDLLNFLYISLIGRMVPASSYEKSWVLVNRGVVIRKSDNSAQIQLFDVAIYAGSELELFLV
jgi:hypothetical protein